MLAAKSRRQISADLLHRQHVTSIERLANKKRLQQGEAAALQRLPTKRFGIIPAEVSSRISTASLEELERWFDLAIEATRFDDVFGAGTYALKQPLTPMRKS